MFVRMIVLAVFVIVYSYLALSKRFRSTALWLGIGVILFFTPVLTPGGILRAINWNVMGIFAGTLILADMFVMSKVPVLFADLLIRRSHSVGMAMLAVCVMSSFISAFAENVATVLIVAPIALQLARTLNVSPKPFLIGIAISSNLQGTATLIGDPPSMILAAHEHMNFTQFFFIDSKPSVFFAVQTGAVFSFIVLYFIFRKYKEPVALTPVTKPTSWFPTGLLAFVVVILSLASFIDPNFRWFGGTACMATATVGVVWQWRRDKDLTKKMLLGYDWPTTFFLAGVFVIVAALEQAGWIDSIAKGLGKIVGQNRFGAYTSIVWLSVLVSAFIDNVPYITTMLPVVSKLSAQLGIVGGDYLLAFGLLIGSCLGGNITPIGASANIVAVGILRKEGHPVSFWEFMRIGLPFTVAATLGGFLLVWFVWG